MKGNGHMIHIDGLTKRYGDVLAVNDLNLKIRKGEVFGFLGPNGAGKTTTIKSILGMILPNEGEISIMGRSVQKKRREAITRVGYLPEHLQLYKNLTGRETLEFFAELRGVEKKKVDKLLNEVGLKEAGSRKVGGYSKGMAQRLALAQCLIGDPPLLILDEPTSGLDPEATTMVKKVVRNYADSGGTVFFSSHILPNVQEVADRVAIITNGKLRVIDSIDNLRDKLELPSRLELQLSVDHRNISKYLKDYSKVKSFRGKGRNVVISCRSQDKTAIIRKIEDLGVKVVDFNYQEGDLEDIFLRYARGDN